MLSVGLSGIPIRYCCLLCLKIFFKIFVPNFNAMGRRRLLIDCKNMLVNNRIKIADQCGFGLVDFSYGVNLYDGCFCSIFSQAEMTRVSSLKFKDFFKENEF